MRSPRISVCLPVWNGAQYLEQAIISVLEQTLHEFELIIIDDGSTDSSRQIIERLAKKDRRIRYQFTQINEGLFANYNKCMRQSIAPLIKLFAQDDLLHREVLEEIYNAFQSNPDVCLVSTNKSLILEDGDQVGEIVTPADLFEKAGVDQIPGLDVARMILDTMINFIGEPSTVALKRSVAGEGFDTTFYHLGDLEYWLRLLANGNYVYLPRKLCDFRKHDRSATNSNMRQLFFATDMLAFINKHKSLCKALSIDTQNQKEKLIRALAAHIFHLSSNNQISSDELLSNEILLARLGTEEIYLNGSANSSKSIRQLMLFRELTYHALLLIGAGCIPDTGDSKTATHVQGLENMIVRRETDVRALLDSLSWRSTRPLCELKKLVTGHQNKSPDFDADSALSGQSLREIAARQMIYLEHLNALERTVLESRSWGLAAPLRWLERKEDTSCQKKIRPAGKPIAFPRLSLSSFKYELSAFTMFRDEARLLKDWIEYHRAIGVEHFYLFNNLSQDEGGEILRPFISEGLVDVIDWPFDGNPADRQGEYVKRERAGAMTCIKMAKDITKWLAILNVDEYLVPVKSDNLPDVLSGYENAGGLCVNWQGFGTSGYRRLPHSKKMIESVTRCARMDHPYNLHVKSIVRPNRVTGCASIHSFEYVDGWHQISPTGVSFSGIYAPQVSSDIIRLNHYWFGPDEEFFEDKLLRALKNAGLKRELQLVEERRQAFNECESDRAILRLLRT